MKTSPRFNRSTAVGFAAKLGVENRKLERGPLWAGPEGEGPQGGVTQSLVGRFLAGRKQFQAYAVDGLAPHESFSPAMEYGSMFHLAIEAERDWEESNTKGGWKAQLLVYCKQLQAKYPYDAEKVAHWYQYALAQFPVYLEFYRERVEERTVLESEQSFDVPYRLPWSGRVVRLRGKRDGLSFIDRGVWLDENKTKSQVDQEKVTRQLRFDLQTMFYLTAMYADPDLNVDLKKVKDESDFIAGVRYNVVKRSTHKTAESMLKKLYEDLQDGRGGEWFGRWKVPVSMKEVQVFRETCLDPVLEWLCVWYDIVAKKLAVHVPVPVLERIVNWRHPYGVYNVMDEGGTSEYDFYLESGSTAGLRRLTTLFPELEG